MKDTLFFIVSNMVSDPKKVAVKEEEIDGIINFNITVAKEDIGRVIGKEGKIIKAIRNVMKIPALKENKRINITLTED
ncbi:MAG: KH domain-containing protein [bacterium]|nr:KH domain-containing protein [bacterium]